MYFRNMKIRKGNPRMDKYNERSCSETHVYLPLLNISTARKGKTAYFSCERFMKCSGEKGDGLKK